MLLLLLPVHRSLHSLSITAHQGRYVGKDEEQGTRTDTAVGVLMMPAGCVCIRTLTAVVLCDAVRYHTHSYDRHTRYAQPKSIADPNTW